MGSWTTGGPALGSGPGWGQDEGNFLILLSGGEGSARMLGLTEDAHEPAGEGRGSGANTSDFLGGGLFRLGE